MARKARGEVRTASLMFSRNSALSNTAVIVSTICEAVAQLAVKGGRRIRR